ncbi:hypothetical protein [Oceanobacillus sp. FSL H7-0719]|uniref:hypothetical protein n=1 Tax=Oceanobacillus sp. FSL H7-0719 TaxID=2954507 RepID=UPI00324A2A12
MGEIQCFKIKKGSEFDDEVKKHFELADKWANVFPRVSKLLGEKITSMVLTTDNLIIDLDEIQDDSTKKLFKKDGALKQNLKESNRIRKEYQEIIDEEGLKEYQELRYINFSFGVMRRRGESLTSFRTSENEIYYEADFDLEGRAKSSVVPISQIEYQEKYLEELKKKDELI